MSGSLAGSTVVVTGASSGLGRHFVGVLLAAGANVVATARREGRLGELLAEHGEERLHAIAGDVTEEGFPAALMAGAAERFGGVHGVVNNAGVTRTDPAESETTADFTRVLAVNLVAAFACAREAFPYLRESGRGSIVNIGSALGLVGIGRVPQASYCAAKGGIVNLTRELAAQWAVEGIRVNCLAPGWFPTELTDAMMRDERSLRFIGRTVPLGRPGKLGELDEVLVLLCGAGGGYMTGQTIAVDGGWTSI